MKNLQIFHKIEKDTLNIQDLLRNHFLDLSLLVSRHSTRKKSFSICWPVLAFPLPFSLVLSFVPPFLFVPNQMSLSKSIVGTEKMPPRNRISRFAFVDVFGFTDMKPEIHCGHGTMRPNGFGCVDQDPK